MTKKSAKAPATKAAPKSVKAAAPKSASVKFGKTALVDTVADQTGLTRAQAGQAVDVFLESVLEAVRSGKSVGLPGLGTMSVKETAARTGVRPGTSEKIQIPAGKKLAFKAATTLKGTL
ncbi:hypothetical protein GCM10008955_38320 [Deinococcus malanensis]|uniref:DNA-binding protein n=1 Tax=Deinococcus malanensis TaxID=1706855 RepID=A0ABQ2F291_9DEIO|nr:HU family DNA-binding protein [Deinococcus malanensis]GGK40870.1 hypothetical protein GCM10008955_38320 [Deinococcus malanensis]